MSTSARVEELLERIVDQNDRIIELLVDVENRLGDIDVSISTSSIDTDIGSAADQISTSIGAVAESLNWTNKSEFCGAGRRRTCLAQGPYVCAPAPDGA